MPSFVSAADALNLVESGNRVFIHGGSATPRLLIDALVARAPELRDVEIVHLHTNGEAPYAKPEYSGVFHVNALFIGANMREAVRDGRADYIPMFLSEIPAFFRKGGMPIDVALVQVSPPDAHGYCSLGVSVDVARAAVQVAKRVIGLVNVRMPRTLGDGLVHVSRFSALVETNEPIIEHKPEAPSPIEESIGQHVASLVDDGATMQMGIGAIPDAVLAALKNHKRLGIHTEMFSDGVVELVERGVITNEEKAVHRGRIVSGFVMGTRKLYDFVHDNPFVSMLDIGYVNDTAVIRKNPKVTAINSAIEIDLTGQVCADTIGTYQFSGVGGQMDFVRGATLSEGGKPIIALPSMTNRGVSRIVPSLKPGAGVTTTRAHVRFVATEYGIADLYGKNLRQRAQALINIAHPSHRESLLEAARVRFGRL